jgi:hypothetical protein
MNASYHQRLLIRIIDKLDVIGDRLTQLTEDNRAMLLLMGWKPPPPPPPVQTPIAVLSHGIKPSKCRLMALRRAGITTIERLLTQTPKELLELSNFGKGALAHVQARLEALGYGSLPSGKEVNR